MRKTRSDKRITRSQRQEVTVHIPFDLLTSICGQLNRPEQARLRDFLNQSLSPARALPESTRQVNKSVFDEKLEAFLAKDADETITLEQVREALSGIRGSLAQAVVEEREER